MLFDELLKKGMTTTQINQCIKINEFFQENSHYNKSFGENFIKNLDASISVEKLRIIRKSLERKDWSEMSNAYMLLLDIAKRPNNDLSFIEREDLSIEQKETIIQIMNEFDYSVERQKAIRQIEHSDVNREYLEVIKSNCCDGVLATEFMYPHFSKEQISFAKEMYDLGYMDENVLNAIDAIEKSIGIEKTGKRIKYEWLNKEAFYEMFGKEDESRYKAHLEFIEMLGCPGKFAGFLDAYMSKYYFLDIAEVCFDGKSHMPHSLGEYVVSIYGSADDASITSLIEKCKDIEEKEGKTKHYYYELYAAVMKGYDPYELLKETEHNKISIDEGILNIMKKSKHAKDK